jgi:hypothetical protein
MALEEAFIAEVNEAVDNAVSEQKGEEGNKNVEENNSAVGSDGSETGLDEQGTENEGSGSTETSVETSAVSDGKEGNTSGSESAEKEPKSVSDFVLTQAVQAGFSVEEAREFGSDKLLMRAVDMIKAAKPSAEPKVAEEQAEDPLAGLPELDPESFEPEVIKAFDSLKDVIRKQQEAISGLQSYAKQAEVSQFEAQKNEIETWFDKQINSLGSDFEDALGKGSYGTLDKASSQYQKREAIAKQTAVLMAGYKSAGLEPPTRDTVFQEAAKLVLMEDYQKIREAKISKDLEKRSGQHINRVGGKKHSSNQDPLDEIASVIDAKYFAP